MKKSSNQIIKWLMVVIAIGVGTFLRVYPAYGQVLTGSIVGTITDSSGAVVPGAKVTVTNAGTNVSREFTTDASGNYSVPYISPGTYSVSAEKEGFTVATHTDITLFAAQTVRVDISLQPGRVTQTVTVSGQAAAALQTDTAQTGSNINTAQVEALPLSQGHNFEYLVSLAPGAEPGLRQHSLFNNAQNNLSSPVNGIPGRANVFNIDGINDEQHSGELAFYVPAMEAIGEVAITTSSYDVSQGGAIGAIINVILKSGSNAFHGEAYETYTGNAFDARNFFAYGSGGHPYHTPHAADNYFGGNVGGPIRKDKTFFFADFLYHYTATSTFFNFSVPTAAMREGIFTDPALGTIYDPTTGDETDCLPGGTSKLCGTGRTQIGAGAGTPNVLTPDPVAAALISHVAPCTICTTSTGAPNYVNNLPLSPVLVQKFPDLDVKIDQYQGQHDHIFGRFSFGNVSTSQAGPWGDGGIWGGPINVGGVDGLDGYSQNKIYSTGINWVHTFSPTLLAETRVGLSREYQTAYPWGLGQNLATQVGVPGVNLNYLSSGIFEVTGEGFSDPLIGHFDNLPWIHAEENIPLMEHWTMIRGNHTMTFGFDYSRIRLEYPDTTALGGAFAFCPGNTSLNGGKAGTFANEFASFMLGVPCSENQSYFYQIPSFLQSQIFPYFGDKWVVNKKLTVNLGLRWEYYSPPTSHFAGGIANYLPSNNTIILNGIGGTSMSAGVQPDYRNWGPRVGLAYRLTNHDVLRAGFSMSSQPYPVDIYINNYQYPDVFNAAWSTLSSYGPVVLTDGTAGSFEKGFEPLVAPVIPSSGVIQVSSLPVLKSSTLYYADQHWRNPYIIAWNFAYERSLPGGWTLDVAYVGNRTPNSAIEYNLNAASVYGEGASGQPEYLSYGRTAATEDFFAQGRNAYDSLQVKTDHHFAQHVLFTSAYTWGKAIGYSEENSSYVSGLQDYVNLRRNYAPTDFNIASILSQSLVWDLPFGKGMPFFTTGVMNHVLGGWQLSGSWNAHTGFPLNFSASNPGFNTPGSNSYPNETGPFKVLHGINPNKWFDTSVFSTPAPGTQGNVGNYVDQGPGFFDLNAALSRTIRINERFKFQVRTEWLHATNTPEFSSPSLTVGSGSFGLVTSTIANTSRIIDVVGKLVF